MTTYTPEQTAAAYRLHDTCHELVGILADEPETGITAWDEWSQSYQTAFRLHDDAEHAYTHAFPDATTRPEAHEVIADATRTRVELLREHLLTDWEWLPGDDIHVTCSCGAESFGELPDHITEMDAGGMWVHAEHVAAELGRA